MFALYVTAIGCFKKYFKAETPLCYFSAKILWSESVAIELKFMSLTVVFQKISFHELCFWILRQVSFWLLRRFFRKIFSKNAASSAYVTHVPRF